MNKNDLPKMAKVYKPLFEKMDAQFLRESREILQKLIGENQNDFMENSLHDDEKISEPILKEDLTWLREICRRTEVGD